MAEKNIYISYLRVIATVYVVLIHASTGFLVHFDATSFNWNYANWINAATRCAVPIFVTITGALLLPKEETTGAFYKKRFPKLFYPFAFCLFRNGNIAPLVRPSRCGRYYVHGSLTTPLSRKAPANTQPAQIQAAQRELP